MNRLMKPTFSLAALALVVPPSAAGVESWPRFRGPNGSGVARGDEPLPADLGRESHLLWKTPLAPGRSSPVVAGGRVYVTGIRGNDAPVTQCLDAETGAILWEQGASIPESGELAYGGGRAQCTCAANEDYVVSFFGSAGLLCHDSTGQLVWHKKFAPLNTQYGVASSPILVDDRIILNQDLDTDSFLMAVRLSDGGEIWKTDRPDFIANFATPVVWNNEGNRQIVVPGSLMVIGYDFETGRQVWEISGLSWSVISTPVLGDNGMLFVNATAPGEEEGAIALPPFDQALKDSDRDDSGTFNRDEFEEFGPRAGFFPTLDRNKDGEIVRSEYAYVDKLWKDSRDTLMAIRPGGEGDITDTHVTWTYRRSLPNAPSPLFHAGHLFMVKNAGIVTSIDAQTGKRVKQARVSGRGDYYSSPVVGDGKIYLSSERGDLTVLRAQPNWKEIAHAELDEEIYATPAIVTGRIYVRTTDHLYCFGFADLEEARQQIASAPAVRRWFAGIAGAILLGVLAVAWRARAAFRRLPAELGAREP